MHQTAALPYRLTDGANGGLEILLVTTGSGRWIIPKGDVDRGMAPHLAAEQEAFEEGGVKGRIADRPIGSFSTRKNLVGLSIPAKVDVYPLEVSEELEHWPEDDRRVRRWLSLQDAAAMVDEPELRSIIRSFRP